jgi:hypothetical protein
MSAEKDDGSAGLASRGVSCSTAEGSRPFSSTKVIRNQRGSLHCTGHFPDERYGRLVSWLIKL